MRCGVHTPVGCSRLLSAVNDLTATNGKNLEKSTRLRLCEEAAQRVSPFYHAALFMISVADFLVNCHELHQESFHCYQDVLDEEMDAIAGIARKESTRVALLQTLGDDGVI